MLVKLFFLFCFFLPVLVLSQNPTKTIDFSTNAGLAVFNNSPKSGVSFGNSFVYQDKTKNWFYSASIRYSFAYELQKERSIKTYTTILTDFDPKFNSVVSTVDFFLDRGSFLLKKENVVLSVNVGLGVRKWNAVKNGEILITDIATPARPNWQMRTAEPIFERLWQLGGDVGSRIEFLPMKKVSFGYKTQYCFFNRNNVWYNELYFMIKIRTKKTIQP
jgi:hypothetical protein